jgi:hypothetical protein
MVKVKVLVPIYLGSLAIRAIAALCFKRFITVDLSETASSQVERATLQPSQNCSIFIVKWSR